MSKYERCDELAELRGRVTSELAELRALVERARFF